MRRSNSMLKIFRIALSTPRALALVLCLQLPSAAFAAEPSPVVRDEVAHLLSYLDRSGCEFFRNGEWHTAAEAKDHLNKKYDYLVKKDLVRTTEDFIRLGAAKSSVSGKPYQVRCKGRGAVASASWLGEELLRYRKQSRASQ